jgi:hypothetical protein
MLGFSAFVVQCRLVEATLVMVRLMVFGFAGWGLKKVRTALDDP